MRASPLRRALHFRRSIPTAQNAPDAIISEAFIA
jgi:hypothetical protein